MSHSMFDLSGRVAIVSGAASGMGKAASLAVAEAGANVVLADLNEAGRAGNGIGSRNLRRSRVACRV